MAKHKKAKHDTKHDKEDSHANKHARHETKPAKQTGSKTIIWVAIAVIALIAVVYALRGGEEQPEIEISPGPTEKVAVDFYVMSQCPYGTQVEDAIAPVLASIGDYVDFNLEYIANDNGDGTFSSLHGENEVLGNIAQLCAMEHEPDKYMEMIVCQNKNAGAIPGNWESCAQESGLDVSTIKQCYEGEEGKDLLRQSIAKSQAVQATGSPTIYIGDQRYQGGRAETDFMRAICGAMAQQPDECGNIPVCSQDSDCTGEPGKVGHCDTSSGEAKCTYSDPVAVGMVIISDERCSSCEELVSRIESQLKSIMLGLETTKYDYSDPEGKALYDELGLTALPAMLFDSNVEQSQGYASVQPYLDPVGEYTSLRVGAQFDPSREICDNGIDDTGNGLADCEDETCKGTLACREEMEQNVQVFIMSDCPYGREAIKALYEVEQNFGDDLDFDVHYIASETGEGFSSLHGQYEVDEDIIQLCVKEHSPDVWLEYINCRSVNGVRGIDWTTCAEETEVDTDAVQACFDGEEGANLLREDIQIAKDLSISASPTWLANNRYKFSGITAEVVKNQFCTYNEGLEGCEATLSAQSAVPSGSC